MYIILGFSFTSTPNTKSEASPTPIQKSFHPLSIKSSSDKTKTDLCRCFQDLHINQKSDLILQLRFVFFFFLHFMQ